MPELTEEAQKQKDAHDPVGSIATTPNHNTNMTNKPLTSPTEAEGLARLFFCHF